MNNIGNYDSYGIFRKIIRITNYYGVFYNRKLTLITPEIREQNVISVTFCKVFAYYCKLYSILLNQYSED